jgi:hypothetical protein
MLSKFNWIGVLVLLAMPLTGQALTLQVNCDQPSSRLPTIGAALQRLNGLVGNLGPNTIEVTGACKENITVDSVSNLTLTAQNGASITDASGGTMPVIQVSKTTNFNLNSFAIRGGGGPFNTAILCATDSTCYFSSNNVQNPKGTAIVAVLGTSITLNNDVLEKSVGGLLLIDTSRAAAFTAAIRNNSGTAVVAIANSFITTNFSTTVENNGGGGIFVVDHSSAQVTATSITGNGGIGVFTTQGSEVLFFPPLSTITGNNIGVAIQSLSWANFNPSAATVSGNTTQPDIVCWGQFSGAQNAAAAGSTSCAP